jgi:hypothetical protein
MNTNGFATNVTDGHECFATNVTEIEVESLFGDSYSTPFGVGRRCGWHPAFHAGLFMFNPFGIGIDRYDAGETPSTFTRIFARTANA